MSSGNINANYGYMGASTYLYWTLGWPYSTGSNSWDKLVVKINGGVTCCSAFSNLAYLTDTSGVTYTALWVNTNANISVYIQATKSSGTTTTFRINNVVNPNPVSYATYQQGLSVTFLWYSVYKTYNKYSLAQPDYSTYSLNSDFVLAGVGLVGGSNGIIYNSHQYYPLTY